MKVEIKLENPTRCKFCPFLGQLNFCNLYKEYLETVLEKTSDGLGELPMYPPNAVRLEKCIKMNKE